MERRVLIAGLFHETHTFLAETTRREDFQVLRGDALLAAAGDGSPLGSALEAGRRLGWRWLPTVDYRAQPSGIVTDDVFEQFWGDFESAARQPLAAGVDAIYLVLHGAMATPSLADVEGEFLERLRALPRARELPVFGVFDLHANFTARMAKYADCLVAYRENPHTDASAMAVRAVELLDRALHAQRRPVTLWRAAPIVWPPTGTGTGDSPLRELEALARSFEAERPGVLAVNVCGGFAFADTPDTGVSFSVVSEGPPGESNAVLEQLVASAWQMRAAGNQIDPPLDEVMARLRDVPAGLTVIAEPSDNIGGGAPGDGTGLLRALVQQDVQRAAICLCDAEAVRQLQDVAIGASVRLPLGGRGSPFDEGPCTLEVQLVSRGAGRFALEDPHSHLASMFGGQFDMGACAVVRQRGLTLLLTTNKTPPFDLGQWRSQGIEPASLAVVGVKAAVAHRRAYEAIAARLWSVDTPGPCRSDLRSFPYRHLRRPIYPLDEFG